MDPYEGDIYKLDCFGDSLAKPKNLEHEFWTDFAEFKPALVIEGKCIRGQEIGGIKLGIPTANFEIN